MSVMITPIILLNTLIYILNLEMIINANISVIKSP